MRKPATKNVGRTAGKERHGRFAKGASRRARVATALERDSATDKLQISKARFEAVMKAAKRSGLLSEKCSRIAGRISPALVEQAKKQTGIEGDSDLIAFALASVALEDNFAEVFKESRGKAPADLKLGF